MRGVTLLELLVVAAIIGVLSVVIVISQGTFNKTLVLKNTAADVALSLHNSQLYGIGSRLADGDTARVGHGLDFANSNTSYISFADSHPAVAASCIRPDICIAGNGFFTNNDTYIRTYSLNNGMTISNFCAIAYPASGSPYIRCKTGTSPTIAHLSISFVRPDTDAVIGAGGFIGIGTTTPLVGSAYVPYTRACVTIQSPLGATRSIYITKVGFIAATSTCP